MYLPDAFAVTDPVEIDDLLCRAGLACLVTYGPEGLFASHLPLVYSAADRSLRGHLAAANPHRRLAGEGEALVLFSGVNAYVSPGLYPSKAEHGRVVPTWNYEAAHDYGRLVWHEDRDWLHANVSALTERFERGRAQPWAVSDAPEPFIQGMLTAIVGVELQITRVQAKRKLSQNRNAADRAGVVAGLGASLDPQDRATAAAMASLEPNGRS